MDTKLGMSRHNPWIMKIIAIALGHHLEKQSLSAKVSLSIYPPIIIQRSEQHDMDKPATIDMSIYNNTSKKMKNNHQNV